MGARIHAVTVRKKGQIGRKKIAVGFGKCRQMRATGLFFAFEQKFDMMGTRPRIFCRTSTAFR